MLGKLLEKFWNRRKDRRRISLRLEVRTTDPEGEPYDVMSEDVSDRGVRLRFEETGLSRVVGHRDEVPLEICLQDKMPPVKAQAQLVWAYNTTSGGSVSGWRFVHFKGNARRRLRNYLDQFEAQK